MFNERSDRMYGSVGDKIFGSVVDVIDGNTFDVQVEFAESANKYPYDPRERIRILKPESQDEYAKATPLTKKELENRLMGKWVECIVETRDEHYGLIASYCLCGKVI